MERTVRPARHHGDGTRPRPEQPNKPQRITVSSGTTSSATSDGLLTPQSDSASISSTASAHSQFQDLAQQVGTIQLSQDVPLPSIEGSSTDSSGGASLSRATTHSRTPSVALTPPPPGSSEILRPSPASRRTASSIDDRLGMSEVAAAIDGVGRDSGSSGFFLRPESPTVENSSSHRRLSRRRSSSRTNTARHDVRDEELPKDRFHVATFQEAFSDAKRLVEELTKVLSSNTIRLEPDSTMRRLHEQASKLACFHCPSTRTVGFVGDSGVGKSSLLNSLLDYKGLARTSDGGAACTSVVTEYHYHSSEEFAIEVEWFSIDETIAQLTELLQAYRDHHFRGTDIDEQELSDLKDRANVAQDTFRAMFRGRLGDEDFLTRWSEADVMRTLRSWVVGAGHSLSGRQAYNSMEDCSTQLMHLTSEQNWTEEPAKWPYIHKVKVFLKAHILSKGLVLVDLPGLRDLNSARREITERYLLKCNEIFAVCCIGRATTDASVMCVFETAAMAKLSHVGIVCTKSGDIRPEEAKRDWGGEKAKIVQKHQDAIARDKRDWDAAKAEVDELSQGDDLDEEEKDDLVTAIRRSKEMTERLNKHQLELETYLISTRNIGVTRALENIYLEKLPGNELKVFCVDNIMYQDHRNLPKDDALPFLQLSGIFTVRKHCIAMVASSQLRHAMKYMNDDIPALLGDIELWVQSGAGTVDAERRAEIRETLNVLEARLKQNLTGNASHISTIARSGRDMFREQVSQGQRIANWTTAATRAIDEWANWSHASYSAFCRQYGDHYTATVGRHNWNEEATERMSSLERDSIFIKDLMDGSMDFTENQLQNSLELADTLGQTMRSRQHLLLADIEQACENFETELRLLGTDAFSGLRTSFVGKLMEESYRECNRDSGRGSDRRRKKTIGDRLSDEIVFISLQRSFKNRFSILAETLQSDIQAAVATHLSVITNTLDIVRNENVAVESERDPEFRGRVERAVRAAMQKVRRLQSVIASSTTGDEGRATFEA